MNPRINSQRITPASSALIPFLPEFRDCRSLIEAAGTAARILTEELGAAGAIVLDENGPVAARPTNLDAPVIAELSTAPSGISAGVTATPLAGHTIAGYPIRNSGGMRLTAAWGPQVALRTDEVRSTASILAEWIHQFGQEDGGGRTRLRGIPARDLNQDDFTDLIETIPAIVYLAEMGESGRWRYVSPQIESVLGYTPEEWMADPNNWFHALHPDDRDYALAFEDQRLIGLDIHPPAEYRLKARDGHYVWMFERARLLPDKDGSPIWHGVMQDISALKSAEVELAQKAEQQLLVARLGDMAVRGEDPDELLRTAASWIGRLDRVLEASIWEQEDYERLHLCHRSADIGQQTVIPFLTSTFPGAPLIKGEPVLIPNWNQQDPRLDPYRDVLPENVMSSAITPILGADQQFGLIIVHSDRAGAFTEEDGNFLLATANVLGNAIERTRSDQSLHYRLNHDLLTELPNRRLFTSRLADAMEAAERDGTMVGLLFLDLDHFKLINDGIGHHAGDEMLREVAPRLSRSVRRSDTVSRFGGDEFGIVLSSVADEAEAWEIAERILAEISQPIAVEGTERLITASVGITVWQPGVDSVVGPEDLIQEADAAMYQAKEAGRARAHMFGAAIQEKMVRRLEVERELHRAIERDELAVAYQPMIDLGSGNLVGFEALVRWRHPDKGLVQPGDFIPIAEESELIRKVDTWVIRQAIAQATEWNRGRPAGRGISISVNSSTRQVRGEGFTDLVSGLLERHDFPPELLTIELTETVLLAGTRQVNTVLEGLKRLGVRLALDDFGTGFSSLSYLGEFPLDEIKIDRKFIDYLGVGDPRGSAIANAIVQIGRSLSMTVVAEAVSSETTLQMVRDLGCHAAQGYLIAKPLWTPDATALIERQDPLYAF